MSCAAWSWSWSRMGNWGVARPLRAGEAPNGRLGECEPLPIGRRRGCVGCDEVLPGSHHATEAAGGGDAGNGPVRRLEEATCLIETPAQDPARRGDPGDLGESTGEVAPAHSGMDRELVDREPLVKVGQCPVDGR